MTTLHEWQMANGHKKDNGRGTKGNRNKSKKKKGLQNQLFLIRVLFIIITKNFVILYQELFEVNKQIYYTHNS